MTTGSQRRLDSGAGRTPVTTSPLGRLQSRLLAILALVATLVVLFPFLWIVLSSFRDPQNFLTLDLGDALPTSVDLSSYRLALGRTDLFRWVGNSLLVAASTTVLSLLVSAPAAFALSRLDFRGKATLQWFNMTSYAVPSIIIVVPLFLILVRLGLNNSYAGLILVHATFTIPFSTWVLRDFYRSIPPDLEEAGYVDGAGLLRVLRYIILPLSVPGLLAAGAYAFILSWNDFLFALVIMDNAEAYTAPVGVHAYFTGRYLGESTWAQLMAAGSIVSLPSVILFGFFQRYLVSGFLRSGVKG